MTMHKAFHPRDDDRLYVSRIDGNRGLASIEDSVDASTQRREENIEKHEWGTDSDNQKQYWQYNGQQNNNN